MDKVNLFDVVELSHFKRSKVKGKTIIMIKNTLKALKTDINSILGDPRDFEGNRTAGKLKDVKEI